MTDNFFVFLRKLYANMSGLELEKTYFEDHAIELLSQAGMSKAQFAKAMNILPQNINKLFATKNVLVLDKVANVLNVSLHHLVYGAENPQAPDVVNGCIYVNGTPTIFRSREELHSLLNQE